MPFSPISREQFSIVPFNTYKAYNLTQASSGVNVITAYSGSSQITASIYGCISNMYGLGKETVFGQKNINYPEQIQLIGISKTIYGDEISPGSFDIVDYYFSPTTVHIIDDGKGNLYDYDYRIISQRGQYIFNGSGSGQYMSGSCDYCSASVEDFMVEFYFKMFTNSTGSGILSRRTSAGGYELYLYSTGSELTFFISDNANNIVFNQHTSLSVANGTMSHVVGAFDRSGDAIFYLNGSSGSVTGINISAVSASISAAVPLGLGIRYNGNLSGTFSGGISTFRFYNFGSGGFPNSSISEYVKFNYNSSSIHHDLVKSLVEEWNWESGSDASSGSLLTTGSISGQSLIKKNSLHYRSNQIIGNIFYSQGFAVITETSNFHPYQFIGSGSHGTGMILNIKSTVKRNEMKVECVSPAGEQNHTTNPSSIWGHNKYINGKNITGSSTSAYQYKHNEMKSYFTTIGLYDDSGSLLAIGKFAQPIPKSTDYDTQINIKIDL